MGPSVPLFAIWVYDGAPAGASLQPIISLPPSWARGNSACGRRQSAGRQAGRPLTPPAPEAMADLHRLVAAQAAHCHRDLAGRAVGEEAALGPRQRGRQSRRLLRRLRATDCTGKERGCMKSAGRWLYLSVLQPRMCQAMHRYKQRQANQQQAERQASIAAGHRRSQSFAPNAFVGQNAAGWA